MKKETPFWKFTKETPVARIARCQQLRTEFAANWPPPTSPDRDAWEKVNAVLSSNNQDPPTWEDLSTAEAEIIRHLSSESLRIKHANIKEEYAIAVGAALSATYFARLAGPNDGTPDQLRAETVDMLAQIHRLRTIRQGFNRMRIYLTALTLAVFVLFCEVVIVYFKFATSKEAYWPPFATTILIAAGMLGGCVSALSRMYSIPWTGELANGVDDLSQTFWSLMLSNILSILEGGIFAVLLYLVFMGKFVEGSMFPVFQGEGKFPYFHEYFEKGLASHSNFGKALVWGFIAGFSERLVPDFLDTLRPHIKTTIKA